MNEIHHIEIASGRSEPIKNHNKFEISKRKNETIITTMVITNKGSISMKIITVTANSFIRKEISIIMIEKFGWIKQCNRSHPETQTDNKKEIYLNEEEISEREQMTRKTENRIRRIKY